MPFPSTGSVPLSNKDLVSFTFDNPSYDVDRPVFIDPEDPSKYYSHRTAKAVVRQLIAGLRASGIKHQDTVLIHSFNSLIYPLLVLAIIGAGGKAVGTNPSYTEYELNHALKLAKARFVFAEPDILPNMKSGLENCGIDTQKHLFVLDTTPGYDIPSHLQSWRVLLNHGSQDWIRFDDFKTSKETPAQLFFSSGTTGLPKCAVTSHYNMVAQHQIYVETNPREHEFSMVLFMPFFHVGVAPAVMVTTLKDGRRTYVMRRFDMLPFLTYHQKYQVTEMSLVPPVAVGIVMSGLADPKSKAYKPEYSLKSVRNATVGAAPCSADIQKRMNSLLSPGATLGQVWGMTETTCVAICTPFEVSRKCLRGEMDVWGSVGKLVPCVEAKLIDEDGNDVTDKGKGQLCIRGPTIIDGYFENEKATKESWDSEGYFLTGDVIEVDKHGLLYVVERVKELIKVRSFQVAPAELEGVLMEHLDIIDAAVIGIKAKQDELPRAYLVKRPGTQLTTDQVHKYMEERLARYKQLAGGIEFVSDIPKLPSGKILKRVLREQWEKQAKDTKAKL